MLTSLQPNRPRLPATHPVSSTFQQIRPSSQAPRTQIEALPPFGPQIQLPCQTHFQVEIARERAMGCEREKQMMDAATRHPVFFTTRLKKAPSGVKAGNAKGSPVCEGYVWEEGKGAREGVKL